VQKLIFFTSTVQEDQVMATCRGGPVCILLIREHQTIEYWIQYFD
jgi:hypothetical protein